MGGETKMKCVFLQSMTTEWQHKRCAERIEKQCRKRGS